MVSGERGGWSEASMRRKEVPPPQEGEGASKSSNVILLPLWLLLHHSLVPRGGEARWEELVKDQCTALHCIAGVFI